MNNSVNTQDFIKVANEADNVVDFLGPSIKYECDDMVINIEYYTITTLPTKLKEWAFDLLKSNMENLYKGSNLGWNSKQKRQEMNDKDCKYLIASNNENPIGFAMFQFTWEETMADDDKEIEVIYCYEIQLAEEARRKGLGTFLMRTLEKIGKNWKMNKVMLTTFKKNKLAMDFYINRLGYQIDEISPSEVLLPKEAKDYDYEILSIKL
ncbi:unnamed protein product [Rhizophagus irregularis]|uniref:N-alpha-acetyltransferase 40 n=1 Tax=Rhizophagus irregularis TaxID=588596 RepID=A0A2I1FYE5_9GLOM|nr:acyl-CoA N-acyltransferase [Rhizophagus irregularis]PKY39397.1 acyl-CoA N-acyltransferase [Rhizophagus irregularis]CAB4379240.1 unnamed protein product [Rhizophagus irregularis]CAB4408792.1 unnamed protein product [Rhizophagus irregularis]CAB5337306.1 unnamed protein product [Rhizophagus irregularis]